MYCISLYGKDNLRKKQNGGQDTQSKNAFLLILDPKITFINRT